MYIQTSYFISVYIKVIIYIYIYTHIYICSSYIYMKRRESVSHSVQFNCSIMSDSSGPHGLQHPRLPCPSPTPRAYSNSCPLRQLCHLIFCHPLLLLPENFPSISVFLSQFFESGGHSFGVSTSVSGLPMNIQN